MEKIGKTLELRKDIQKLLKEVASNVSYKSATEKTSFPYVVYKIKDYGEYLKQVEIDVWNKGTSTEVIENLVDDIENRLNDEIVCSDMHTIIFCNDNNRQWLEDQDKELQRINLSYTLNYYGKEK